MSKNNKWLDLKPLKLDDDNLQMVEWNNYYKEKFPKNQIVLHHTVSGPGIRGDLITWKKYKSNIGTCIIIDRDGTINQLFSSKYWAYHLGAGNSVLDRRSIAVELDNWGQLEEKKGKLYTIYGNVVKVPTTNYPLGFRGEQLFESYPDAQLESLGELLLFWNKRYDITMDYNEDMWDVSQNALDGKPGIWTHVSYRPWPASRNKWDCHPQPELINMLKTLSKLT
jgi:N-acetyl-anhydromuramyl-L-alanine amidase AmpD